MQIDDTIGQVSSWLTGVGVVLAALISSFKIYLDYRREVAQKGAEEQKFRAQQSPDNLDNLGQLLIQNFQTLNSFYSENLSQYRTSSLASISIAILGFVVIIAGLLLALLGNQVAVGTVSASAGVIAEAASYLFFRQNQTFQAQMEGSLKKLVSAQYLMTAIALAREMSAERKDAEISDINSHLRDLMDTLHDLPLRTTPKVFHPVPPMSKME